MADMSSPAAKAYLDTLKSLQSGGAEKTAEVAPVSGPSFGSLVEQSLNSAIDAQHESESVSAKGLIGEANMTDVLQAVNDAEMALNTVIAIRDRVIEAYETILRTPM
ncbi:MAG: flagellar hook-basal body complex protein FliE [Alphaproteobacteria bacterium]|nr:flagellar hook-basal body complex protein FliE [Alphaproteobacteria bacterium]